MWQIEHFTDFGDRKSENEDLKREMESLKAPSTAVRIMNSSPKTTAANIDQPEAQSEMFSENFKTSVELARANSTQRYLRKCTTRITTMLIDQ